ncbi:MAG TPA: hypothetical protein DCY81_04325 [Lachnospiraceae bacterium]|nr:hypothetical protein [Lachnospiraceae bacterium]
MRSKLFLLMVFFRVIYTYLFLLLGGHFILFLFKQDAFGWKELLVTAALVIISYLVRLKAGNNLIVFIVHIAAGAAGFFILSTVANRIVFILNVLVMMITAIRSLRRDTVIGAFEEVPWPVLFIGTFMYWLGLEYNNPGIRSFAYFLPVLIILVYLVILYLDGVSDYFGWTKDVSDVPVNRMLKVNSVIFLGIVIFSIVALVLAYVFKLDELFVRFLKSLVWVLRLIFLGFKLIYELFYALFGGGKTSSLNDKSAMEEMQEIDRGEMTEGGRFIVVLAIIIIAAVVLYFVLRKIIRALLSRRNTDSDTVVEIKEKIKNESEKKTSLLTRIKEKLSNEERVRRMYKNNILRLDKPGVPIAEETTVDIEKRLMETSGDDVSGMTEIYNMIRYGSKEADLSTVREMRKRINKIPK